jgi:hypothetical protein
VSVAGATLLTMHAMSGEAPLLLIQQQELILVLVLLLLVLVVLLLVVLVAAVLQVTAVTVSSWMMDMRSHLCRDKRYVDTNAIYHALFASTL